MSISDPVIILIIGSTTALLGLLCKLSYSSKCTKVKCCCIEIERDTEHEQVINISSASNRSLSAV